jgi:hypothetical protein
LFKVVFFLIVIVLLQEEMVHHDFYQVKLERDANLSIALHTPKGARILPLILDLSQKIY